MGYDISDYEDIDPLYGTLADVDTLIQELKKRGMHLIMDLVVNHTSNQVWFILWSSLYSLFLANGFSTLGSLNLDPRPKALGAIGISGRSPTSTRVENPSHLTTGVHSLE